MTEEFMKNIVITLRLLAEGIDLEFQYIFSTTTCKMEKKVFFF